MNGQIRRRQGGRWYACSRTMLPQANPAVIGHKRPV